MYIGIHFLLEAKYLGLASYLAATLSTPKMFQMRVSTRAQHACAMLQQQSFGKPPKCLSLCVRRTVMGWVRYPPRKSSPTGSSRSSHGALVVQVRLSGSARQRKSFLNPICHHCDTIHYRKKKRLCIGSVMIGSALKSKNRERPQPPNESGIACTK